MTQRGKVAVSDRMLGFAIWACSRRFSGKNRSTKSTFASREFFLFLNLGRGLPAVCNSFGRDCRFILQNGLVGCFLWLPCGGLQACETSRVGPPSRIADPGLF